MKTEKRKVTENQKLVGKLVLDISGGVSIPPKGSDLWKLTLYFKINKMERGRVI